MADYSTIKGFTIQSLASDPVVAAIEAGTWASGGAVNTARYAPISAGTVTAGLLAGGAPPTTDQTEEYNGTAWTEVTAMPARRANPAAGVTGTQTAAISIGGVPAPFSLVYDYNGSTWTAATGNLNTARYSAGGCGTQTAALGFGGEPPVAAVTESYNGTAWTETGDLNTARAYLGGLGSNTAALAVGGFAPPTATQLDLVEQFDGTSWTEIADINTARVKMGSTGTTTEALIYAGITTVSVASTEAFNGTAWTEIGDLATARREGGSAGTAPSALMISGEAPGGVSPATEEFSVPSTASVAQKGQVWYNTTSTVLKGFGTQGTGAWASGGTVPGYYYGGSLGGTQTAAVVAGGNPGQTTLSFEYDGTSWSATNPLNQGRMYTVCAGFGPQTASQVAGGETTVYLNNSEQYDGTSWAAVNPMLNSLQSRSIGGTQAGAIAISGHPGPTTAVEDWDGTSFSAGTASPEGRGYGMGGGTQTSAISCGGTAGIATADVWDGTSWTEIADMNSGRHNSGRAITSDSNALIFAGEPQPAGRGVLTEEWNGTSWTELADLATAGNKRPGCGTPLLAMCAGNESPNDGITEEWTVPDAIKTFTAS